ncbi:MAG: NYN domain-containing protein [Isosphaeraceae bacterium]
MRWLIDGYNVMYAAGILGPRLGREGFRRARRRFLDELAEVLPTGAGSEVTVVFDARVPPGDFPIASTYRGMRVLFALGDEDADSRIEFILDRDSNPQNLNVVSTDRRIRQAARRRRARPMTADEFWDQKDRLGRPKRPQVGAANHLGQEQEPDREGPIDPDEARFWVEAFRDVEHMPGIRDVPSPSAALLSDDEIAEIQRIIDREG